MYSVPPKESTRKREENPENETTEEDEKTTVEVELETTETESKDNQITPGTDTNWTGNVPADD